MNHSTLKKEENLDQALKHSFPASDPLPITPKFDHREKTKEDKRLIAKRIEMISDSFSAFNNRAESVLAQSHNSNDGKLMKILDTQFEQMEKNTKSLSSLL